MKKLLILLATLALTLSSKAADITVDAAHFPDTNFRSWVLSQSWGRDGVITDAEIETITEIVIKNEVGTVHDLTGLGLFPNVESIYILKHQMKNLPVSNLTKLKSIWVYGTDSVASRFEEPVDLSHCTELEYLGFIDYTFESGTINLSNLTKVKKVEICRCELESLDLSSMTNLKQVRAIFGHLRNINLSNNLLLEYVDLQHNYTLGYTNGTLNFSHLSHLKYLDCSDCDFSGLNISGCTQLEYLSCFSGSLKVCDMDFSANTALRTLICASSSYPSYESNVLHLSNLPNLQHLDLSRSGVTGVIFNNLPNLTFLDVGGSQMGELDLMNVTTIDTLICEYCGLTSLVPPFYVKYLNCYYNENLKTLDLTNYADIHYLDIRRTGIEYIDVSDCYSSLKTLKARDGKLTTLDLSHNRSMEEIDVSQCSDLKELKLPTFTTDLPNTSLKKLTLTDSGVRYLDLANFAGLEELEASSAELEDIRLENNSSLHNVSLRFNKLSHLDLSSLTQYFSHAPGVDGQKNSGSLYSYDGKLYLKLNPKYNNFDVSRVSNFQVNYQNRTPVLRDGCLLEVGSEGASIIKVSFQYDTQFSAGNNLDATLDYTFTVNGQNKWIIPIDAAHFPDPAFRNIVSQTLSDDPDWLKQEVADSYYTMYLNSTNIEDLTGLEYFEEIDSLYCEGSKISKIDVSMQTNLKFLCCSHNYINPTYNPMAVATLLESLPDFDDIPKKLYYRIPGYGEHNAQLTYQQCQYLKAKYWTPYEYKSVDGVYGWYEIAGVSTSQNITVKNKAVTDLNCNDVLGNGTVSYDPIRNVLTLNGFTSTSLGSSTQENVLVCGKEDLVIKLLGNNELVGTATFSKNTTLTGPGTLKMRLGSTVPQMLVTDGNCLHIGDSAHVVIASNRSDRDYGKGIKFTENSSLRIDGDHATLTIDAYDQAVEGLAYLIMGEGYRIETPVHGHIDRADSTIVKPNGTPVKKVTIQYAPIYGDANNDTYLDETDIDALVDVLLGIDYEPEIGADTNHDGQVSITDLTCLVNRLETPFGWVVKPVTEITLSKDTLTLPLGNTETLTATLLPEDAELPDVVWASSDETVATVSQSGVLTSVNEGTCVISCSSMDGNATATCQLTVAPTAFVDLGLPSGTLWAKMNVGATAPELIGSFFAWGEIEPKTRYSWSTYFDTTNEGTSFITFRSDGVTVLPPSHDASTQINGSDFQIPDTLQWRELLNYCTLTCDTINNNKGGLTFTSTINGKSIYLPFSGVYGFATPNRPAYTKRGFYWTSNLNIADDQCAYFITFYLNNSNTETYIGNSDYQRYMGMPIRPVKRVQQ